MDNALKIESTRIAGPAGPLTVRSYRPAGAGSLAAVIYCHGGGFVGGTLDDADVPAAAIAAGCPALVLSVDYALAPARPFPAAPEDAYAALTWAVDQAARLGLDASRLAVAGDDAGGSLAAAVTLMSRDRGGPALAAQVLIAPMLDPSMVRLGDAAALNSDTTPRDCAACYQQYLPKWSQRLHPYAAPIESSRLAGLPAAFIATAACDVLCSEAEQYADGLIKAGVPTQVARYAQATHASLNGRPDVLADVVAFLRHRLSPRGSAFDRIAPAAAG